MYFDQNILRILFSIPEDVDITEAEDLYIANCLSAAVESLVVFRSTETTLDDDFLEESIKFESIISDDSEDQDLEMARNILKSLRENPDFNEMYQGYLDVINKKLYDDAATRDPAVKEELSEYLELLRDSYVVEYFERFANPLDKDEIEDNN